MLNSITDDATLPVPTSYLHAAPAVSHVGNMASSGGLTATVSGLAFASVDATPTGTIAGADCATSSWASGTTVQCLVMPAMQPGCAAAFVTVSSVAGTGLRMFTFDGNSLLTHPRSV